MYKFKCIISYIGKNFDGWIGGNNSISNKIEEILKKIDVIKIYGASRTDKETNALGQCFHFESNKNINWKNFLNAYLPNDIRILSCEIVDGNFQARFDAKYRIYRYYLSDSFYVYFKDICFYYKYSVENIEFRIRELMKKNDFSEFCNGEINVTMDSINIFYIQLFENKILTIEFKAQKFFYHQIRRIVYYLLTGKKGLVPAYGLHLHNIGYNS